MKRAWIVVELAALAAAIVAAWWLGSACTSAWLARVARLPVKAPDPATVKALARHACVLATAGIAILAAGRVVGLTLSRRRLGNADPLVVPWLLPAMVGAVLVGLTVHLATVEVVHGAAEVPSGASFAGGFLVGAIGAAVVLALPVDLPQLLSRARVPIALAIGAIFAALAVVGSGPAGSGTRINLGPIQPIELVKLLAVAFLGAYLGVRAPKLRWQRARFLGLRWPRVGLLVPALGVLVGIVAGLRVIGDLGPVLLLALVFLGMFFVASRATGWVVVAIALLVAMVLVLGHWPGIAGGGTVKTRLVMWQDPWTNGLANGHQLGEGRWAIAAGGWEGRGLAEAATPLVPAGKTDLVMATLTEQLGARGLIAYEVALVLLVLGAIVVAARSRTAERVMLASGIAVLVLAQWLVILGGTLGYLPLTGIVVPFVSAGRSSMAVFVIAIALVARLSVDGRVRVASPELDELHASARGLGIASALLSILAIIASALAATTGRVDIQARPIATRLADGTPIARQNPRLLALAARIPRGPIVDRHGAPLAETTNETRRYPLGDALGTLLGTAPSRVLLPTWASERQFDDRLRGYTDMRGFVPWLDLDASARDKLVAATAADTAPRTAKLSLDGRLQARVVALAKAAAAKRGYRAVIAVVVDVATGQVLARAQVPDLDPNDATWQARILANDRAFLTTFRGAYGAWPDKTGVQGMFQAGSVGKLVTSIAAVRAGVAETRFDCRDRDAQGPMFTRPGWPKPIHDFAGDPVHGTLDLPHALAVSCNVYFGQLGLALGPEPFAALRRDGLGAGYGETLAAGGPDTRQLASTAFGQGAMVMNAMQAARLVAAIADGGRYTTCSPTMELGAPCTTRDLVADPATLRPVVQGMRLVMTSGTGVALTAPAGVRVYGKTGTADVQGFAGEEPFGIARAAKAAPHSWFAAFAEPSTVEELASRAPGRLAVVVVVPRGGTGAAAAGPLVMQILGAARELEYLK